MFPTPVFLDANTLALIRSYCFVNWQQNRAESEGEPCVVQALIIIIIIMQRLFAFRQLRLQKG